MKKNFNINEVKTITQAMTMPVFSLVMSGNFMAVMKHRIMEETGLENFPIIVLTGQPVTGKSAVFKAVVSNQENETDYMIIEYVDNTVFYKETQPVGYIGDNIVRSAYHNASSVVGMEIGTNSMKSFSEAAIKRMLIESTDGFWNGENQSFTMELCQCKETLAEIKVKYQEWFAHQKTSFDKMLKVYEKFFECDMGFDARTVHKTFFYYATLVYYFKFLEEEFPEVFTELNVDRVNWVLGLGMDCVKTQESEEMKCIGTD